MLIAFDKVEEITAALKENNTKILCFFPLNKIRGRSFPTKTQSTQKSFFVDFVSLWELNLRHV
jgi:hypothetical protein